MRLKSANLLFFSFPVRKNCYIIAQWMNTLFEQPQQSLTLIACVRFLHFTFIILGWLTLHKAKTRLPTNVQMIIWLLDIVCFCTLSQTMSRQPRQVSGSILDYEGFGASASSAATFFQLPLYVFIAFNRFYGKPCSTILYNRLKRQRRARDPRVSILGWCRHLACGHYCCKLVNVFETCFPNCFQATCKAPKTDVMSPHLSHRDTVAQTFLADYGTTKNSCQV